MVGLLAKELMLSLQVYDYRKCILFISYGIGMSRADFSTRDDYNRWQVDTSLTFRGKRCKTLNPDFLFNIFSRYSGDEPQTVRALMIKWIHENREQFDKATFIGMAGKDLELDQWLIDMESPRMIGDEFALFALCKLFNRHARVLNRGKTWHTVSVEGSHSEQYIEEACDVHLLYLTKDTIAELKRKTTGMVPSVDNTAAPNIARTLGLCNMALPDMPIPTLPDETIQNTEEAEPVPPKIVPLQDYVTTLGGIVSLPQDALDIPENLIQRDDIMESQTNEPVPVNNNEPPVQTIPCSIKLRRISATDVSKWQKKKLPDETTSVGTCHVNRKYNLRDKKAENTYHSARPQCAISKPPTYADPTNESSQDLQIIGTIYSLDKRPIPDEKLEKIVGLSEPSAYRMGAQNYIEVKCRGELPAPPTHKLYPDLKLILRSQNSLMNLKPQMKVQTAMLQSSKLRQNSRTKRIPLRK